MIKIRRLSLAIVLLAAVVQLSCVSPGPMEEIEKFIPLGDIESAKVDLRIRAGEMDCEGGSEGLLEGRFLTNVEGWKPDITYDARGDRGYIKIHQKANKGINLGRKKNVWELRLSDSKPLDLVVDMGAGECRLNLSRIMLESLTIDIGVGELNLVLPERISRRVRVKVDGGIGSAVVIIPETVGARVEAEGGIGSIDIQGMKKKGSTYFNSAFDYDKPYFDISIEGGIGSIDVRSR